MSTIAQRETPHVGIYWVVQTQDGEARLLAAGCPLDHAEPYGDCLTYGPGHYETWTHWRRDRSIDPALRALVRAYEYEDWPRGRIVFDQARDLFILYADRKLLTPARITRLETHFQLPEERTSCDKAHDAKGGEQDALPPIEALALGNIEELSESLVDFDHGQQPRQAGAEAPKRSSVTA